MSEQPSEESIRLSARPEIAAGVWANIAGASLTRHEITLDLVRQDPRAPIGYLVARVAMSPMLLEELIRLLERTWHTWSRQQIPEEGPRGPEV